MTNLNGALPSTTLALGSLSVLSDSSLQSKGTNLPGVNSPTNLFLLGPPTTTPSLADFQFQTIGRSATSSNNFSTLFSRISDAEPIALELAQPQPFPPDSDTVTENNPPSRPSLLQRLDLTEEGHVANNAMDVDGPLVSSQPVPSSVLPPQLPANAPEQNALLVASTPLSQDAHLSSATLPQMASTDEAISNLGDLRAFVNRTKQELANSVGHLSLDLAQKGHADAIERLEKAKQGHRSAAKALSSAKDIFEVSLAIVQSEENAVSAAEALLKALKEQKAAREAKDVLLQNELTNALHVISDQEAIDARVSSAFDDLVALRGKGRVLGTKSEAHSSEPPPATSASLLIDHRETSQQSNSVPSASPTSSTTAASVVAPRARSGEARNVEVAKRLAAQKQELEAQETPTTTYRPPSLTSHSSLVDASSARSLTLSSSRERIPLLETQASSGILHVPGSSNTHPSIMPAADVPTNISLSNIAAVSTSTLISPVLNVPFETPNSRRHLESHDLGAVSVEPQISDESQSGGQKVKVEPKEVWIQATVPTAERQDTHKFGSTTETSVHARHISSQPASSPICASPGPPIAIHSAVSQDERSAKTQPPTPIPAPAQPNSPTIPLSGYVGPSTPTASNLPHMNMSAVQQRVNMGRQQPKQSHFQKQVDRSQIPSQAEKEVERNEPARFMHPNENSRENSVLSDDQASMVPSLSSTIVTPSTSISSNGPLTLPTTRTPMSSAPMSALSTQPQPSLLPLSAHPNTVPPHQIAEAGQVQREFTRHEIQNTRPSLNPPVHPTLAAPIAKPANAGPFHNRRSGGDHWSPAPDPAAGKYGNQSLVPVPQPRTPPGVPPPSWSQPSSQPSRNQTDSPQSFPASPPRQLLQSPYQKRHREEYETGYGYDVEEYEKEMAPPAPRRRHVDHGSYRPVEGQGKGRGYDSYRPDGGNANLRTSQAYDPGRDRRRDLFPPNSNSQGQRERELDAGPPVGRSNLLDRMHQQAPPHHLPPSRPPPSAPPSKQHPYPSSSKQQHPPLKPRLSGGQERSHDQPNIFSSTRPTNNHPTSPSNQRGSFNAKKQPPRAPRAAKRGGGIGHGGGRPSLQARLSPGPDSGKGLLGRID
ncbi:hypothetical protein DL96DRAFT_1715750 [Flagelloscypha sp. PMI_526]|nr:hypothetical protein DL96DRAFT_1715750 [Flagelloscypha sp. PMI_526]